MCEDTDDVLHSYTLIMFTYYNATTKPVGNNKVLLLNLCVCNEECMCNNVNPLEFEHIRLICANTRWGFQSLLQPETVCRFAMETVDVLISKTRRAELLGSNFMHARFGLDGTEHS